MGKHQASQEKLVSVVVVPGDDDSAKKEETPPPVKFSALFRFATRRDKMLIAVAVLSALIQGALMPVFSILFGEIIDGFDDTSELRETVRKFSLYIFFLGIAAMVAGYFQVSLFVLTGARQANCIRKAYFKSLLRQDMSWYDSQVSGQLTTRIASDVPKIQDAISDKAGSYVQFMSMALTGFIVGFVTSWELSLVVLSVVPLMIISATFFSKVFAEMSQGGQQFYAEAGGIADEVITLIKTVIAFGTADQEVRRYRAKLEVALSKGVRAAKAQGLSVGFTMFVIFSSYGLVFWYGNRMSNAGRISPGEIVTVFFTITMGAMAIGQAAPAMAAFAAGRGAAVNIYEVIDRTPSIDSLDEGGKQPETIEGAIRLNNVKFAYPTRPDEPVLKGLSIDIPPNSSLALIGPSGCGKSTILSLLERFYDPASGSISLDGIDTRELNTQWLRSQIGLVSQTSVLFPTSIFNNIAAGKDGATLKEVQAAAEMANAHTFISEFPDGYETMVGDQGDQLSGGQRQRIAIARALIKDPKILLLDEATSALDTESERVVQAALDAASEGRTTITIAHRLSTIINSDLICVMTAGNVAELGTHNDLLGRRGLYAEMLERQHINTAYTEDTKVAKKAVSATASKKVTGSNTNMGTNLGTVEEEEEELPEVGENVVWWALRQSGPERWHITAASLAAILEGLTWPAWAVALSEVLQALLNADSFRIRVFCIMFGCLGVFTFIAVFTKFYLGAIAGERLTLRLRERAFKAILRQRVEWFDNPKNAKGILTERLASDAAAIRQLTGDKLMISVQQASSLLGGLLVAFIYCWEVALVVLGAGPAMMIAGALQLKLMTGFSNSKMFEESGRFASQAVENITTVASLGRMRSFLQDYSQSLISPMKATTKVAQVQGLGFAFTQMASFAIWSLAFWFGSIMVDKDRCSFANMFKAISGVIFGAMITGQLQALAPDYVKAKRSATFLYDLVTKTDAAYEESKKTEATAQPSLTGKIEFKDVDFSYPLRPDAPVLAKMNLSVEPGKTLALVGRSGCGKSTVIALLEHFYTKSSGQLLIDGMDIEDISEPYLRQQIAFVMQEPHLFSMTIRENIAYGAPTDIAESKIVAAAKAANAHDFIMEFSDGYDTRVGEKGIQLSGGQRQRVAIARALLRQQSAKIFLLDEATAALDSLSESRVQQALEATRGSSSTIVIAHRLSTIRSADAIAVVDQGRIVELGTHTELMAKQGIYADLVTQQWATGDEAEELLQAAAATTAAAAGKDSSGSAPGPSNVREFNL